MKVKDQLKIRREQLGISVNELAKRLGVSGQAIRHWESGRSFPGKSKTTALETALSFSIDWTEGARTTGQKVAPGSLIDPNDVELLLKIARLPPPAKALFGSLVDLHLNALDEGGAVISERIKESPARPFYEAPPGEASGKQGTQTKPAKTKPRGSVHRSAARRKAA